VFGVQVFSAAFLRNEANLIVVAQEGSPRNRRKDTKGGPGFRHRWQLAIHLDIDDVSRGKVSSIVEYILLFIASG